MSKHKKWMCLLIFFMSLLVFYPQIRSYSIMYIFSKIEEKNSFMNSLGIRVYIPGGVKTLKKDWYPFVMTFNSSEDYSRYIDKPVDLTILYNFGAFDIFNRSSMFYNPDSMYYSAFYGAYVIRDRDGIYGYNNDYELDYAQISALPAYDMKELILRDLGYDNPLFDIEVLKTNKLAELAGYTSWDVIEGRIVTNGPNHQSKSFKRHYIQFGSPTNSEDEFPVVELKGRIYSRYFDEINTTIYFYVIGPTWDMIDSTEMEFIKKAQIQIKN